MSCLNCEKVWLQGCHFFSFVYRSNNDNGRSNSMSKAAEIMPVLYIERMSQWYPQDDGLIGGVEISGTNRKRIRRDGEKAYGSVDTMNLASTIADLPQISNI